MSERLVEFMGALDVVGVLNSRGDDLDVGYIESWIDTLGVRQSWQEVLSRRELTTG